MASKPPNPRLCTVPKAVCRQYARHLLDLAKAQRFSPAERASTQATLTASLGHRVPPDKSASG